VILGFLQQRAQRLLGEPPRQLMNRCVCLIERGQQRRGRGFLPERDYRLVDGERGATQFIHHDGCSDFGYVDFGCVIFAASAAGAVTMQQDGRCCPSDARIRTAAEGSSGSGGGPASAREGIDGQACRLLGVVTLSGVRRERRLAVQTTVILSPEWRSSRCWRQCAIDAPRAVLECQAAPMRGERIGQRAQGCAVRDVARDGRGTR
jgi:hypothetical protein